MQFEETNYVSVELTVEEKETIEKAKDIINKLYNYALEKEKSVVDYATYDGTMSMDIKTLCDVTYDLENIYNIEGVE